MAKMKEKVMKAESLEAEAKKVPETVVPETNGNQENQLVVPNTVSSNLPAIDYNSLSPEQYQQFIDSATDDNSMQQGEMQFSRIAILQPLSPEIANRDPGYEPGMLVNNLSREVLTVRTKAPWLKARGVAENEIPELQACQFVPIFKLPSEFIEWKDPNTEGQGWHFKTLDYQDKRVREGTWAPFGFWKPPSENEKSPPVTVNMNFLGMVLDLNGMPLTSFIVATFSRTSYSHGRTLFSKLQENKIIKAPYWHRTFYLFTKREFREKFTWYEMRTVPGIDLTKVDPDGIIREQCFTMAKALSNPTPTGEKAFDGKPLTQGRKFQEMMINAAYIETEHGVGGGTGDNAGEVAGASEDIF